MKEITLQTLWKYKLFNTDTLRTVDGKTVQIISFGKENIDAGPDFLFAKIKIDQQIWVGNVEIHVDSSDWYAHKHEIDKNYDAVILHVVWDYSVDVFSANNTPIPTLTLKPFTSEKVLNRINDMVTPKNKWINCEQEVSTVSPLILGNWLDRLYVERLQRKSIEIQKLLENNKNDWEATLFIMLAKNMGLRVNGESFKAVAESIPFSIVRKLAHEVTDLEALFLGQSGLLNNEDNDNYVQLLKSKYEYQKVKYSLKAPIIEPIKFFRLRPLNFPTIRWAQLAMMYHKTTHLFNAIIESKTAKTYYTLFSIAASTYWDSHYTFSKESNKKMPKKSAQSFIDLLLINTLIPLKFLYLKTNTSQPPESILTIIQEIKPENNTIIKNFDSLSVHCENALESQALLQLKNEYCTKFRCLECPVGISILKPSNLKLD